MKTAVSLIHNLSSEALVGERQNLNYNKSLLGYFTFVPRIFLS
ncbi:hypothetical protein [Hydrocoleum sp. CS-953]|nr:hypothetical protein [Hydrocoleum sp. CS-953]